MDGVLGAIGEPHGGAHAPQRHGPIGAQAARPQMGGRLPAAFAPGRSHGAKALPAQRARETGGVAFAEQRVTQRALSGKQELLECRAKHEARAAPPRA